MTPKISGRHPCPPPGGSVAPSFTLCLGPLTFALWVPGAWGQTPGMEERTGSLRGGDSPPPHRIHHIDTYHGVRIPDPYRWLEEVDAPETRRWVEGDGAPVRHRFSGAGVVETDYEQQTLIVYERTPTGWLRIRTEPPSPGADRSDGTWWTHECLLSLGDVELEYEPWEEMLTGRYEGAWLYFRTFVPHNLREWPGVEFPRVGVIGGDHEMFVQEISGPWMRVRVREPAWSCVGPEMDFSGRERGGWVKWWGEDRGPWVWFPTRGC